MVRRFVLVIGIVALAFVAGGRLSDDAPAVTAQGRTVWQFRLVRVGTSSATCIAPGSVTLDPDYQCLRDAVKSLDIVELPGKTDPVMLLNLLGYDGWDLAQWQVVPSGSRFEGFFMVRRMAP